MLMLDSVSTASWSEMPAIGVQYLIKEGLLVKKISSVLLILVGKSMI